MDEKPSHTMHAQQGFEFADIFAYKFKGREVGRPPRHLVLREPDGPSTAGGKQARQSIVLQTEAGDPVVCGWVDLAQKTAEIRAFGYINEQFRQRRGHILEVSADDYEALMKEVAAFLKVNRLDVQRAERPAVMSAGETPSPRQGGLPMWLVLTLSVLGGLLLGYLLFG